jgi:hypothetical protein
VLDIRLEGPILVNLIFVESEFLELLLSRKSGDL